MASSATTGRRVLPEGKQHRTPTLPSGIAYDAALRNEGPGSEVNWIGGICVLAIVVLIVAVATDLQMISCQAGSLYSMVGLCRPGR
jgi:hypothetical protein